MKQTIFLLLFILFATTKAKSSENPSPSYIGNHPLYGKIEKIDGSFYFTELRSFNSRPSFGAWVLLNDLSPAMNTKKENFCISGKTLYGGGPNPDKECKTLKDNPFRKTKMALSDHIIRPFVFIFSFGSAGSAKFSDVVFDEKSFERGVNIALQNSKLSREEVILASDQLWEEHHRISENYQKQLQSMEKVFSITDLSGFYKNEIDFNAATQVHLNILPAPSSLNIEIKKDESIAKTVNTTHNQYKDHLRYLASHYMNTCNKKSSHGYNIDIFCDPTIPALASPPKNIHYAVTINSKNFLKTFPTSFSASDRKVKIEIDGNKIIATNKTNQYITVDSLSVYYSDGIYTKSDMQYVMPPESQGTISSLHAFTSHLDVRPWRNVTAEEMKNSHIKVGISARYQSTENDSATTLINVKELKKESIILSAI